MMPTMTVSTGQPARAVPTSARKRQLAGSLRRVADAHGDQLPETITHKHIRDAAARLDRGDTSGAIRHLQTAAHSLTPQSMYRHGVQDDGGHQAARRGMYEVTRHILLIKDVQDDEAGNASILARKRDAATPPAGPPPRPSAAMNAPNTTNSGGPGNEANGPAQPAGTTGGVGTKAMAQICKIAIELAEGRPAAWREAIELSAQTGALATTPHPFGRPGGPGLWNVKGMELPPYIQNIARALLRTGRAKDLGSAIAIAKAATSRWAHGKNTKPEVRAASVATDASWQAKRARAHASGK
jgi:hypothetical protein